MFQSDVIIPPECEILVASDKTARSVTVNNGKPPHTTRVSG